MQSYRLQEQLGSASEPSSKGEYLILRLPFISRGDILVATLQHKRDQKTIEDWVEFHLGSQCFIFLLSVMNWI